MKIATSIISLFILFTSCTKHNSIVVLFENADGLQKNDPVQQEGLRVGSVHRLSYDVTKHIIAEIDLDNDVKIPSDSRIVISGDLLGEKYIVITGGSSSSYLQTGDTINGIQETGSMQQQMQSAGKALQNFFESKTSTQDSILIELRRLNDNLEEMNKK